jgi:predicted nucleotidyltransferase
MLHERFNDILDAVRQACLAHYGDGLISLAVFGSVARDTMRPDSDVDLLVVVNSLPRGRLGRSRDFEAVEAAAAEVLSSPRERGSRPPYRLFFGEGGSWPFICSNRASFLLAKLARWLV